MGVSHCEPEAMDSVETMVVNTGEDTDVKDTCNNVTEEIKIAPHDLTNKPVSLILEHLRLRAHIFY